MVITDAGTPLERLAARWSVRRCFTHGPGTGADVGGRFSGLAYFGFVPAALMGVDVAKLLQRVQTMFARCGPRAPGPDHPGLQLGAVLGRDKP